VQSQHVAVDSVRGIIDRFCEGSVENLLLGMVDSRILTPDMLEALAQKIAAAEDESKKRQRSRSTGD